MWKLDEKLVVTLGGLPQKIHIRSNDETLPVLLFLHGGPGVANRHNLMKMHSDLLDTVTLVGWDQRGTGGSFKGATVEQMTIKQLTDDAAELVDWLCQRFKKDKIFIIGGSWGSLLGTFLAYRYPAKIAAYVGLGQLVDGTKNEELSYKFALDEATKAGDIKSIKKLEDLGPPVKGLYKGDLKGLMIQRKIMMKYGGNSPNKKKRGIFRAFIIPMFTNGEYTLSEIIGILKGYKFTLNVMWPEIAVLNLAAECPKFEMPYFILNGRLDNNTPASLVDGYYENVEAPKKDLIWFENSGHNPMGDEPDAFKTALRRKINEVTKEEREKGTII